MAVTIIVQGDGVPVANANSFIDQSFADPYFSDRGGTAAIEWAALSSDAKDTAIFLAANFLVTEFCYKGQLSDDALTVPFPRVNLVDRENRSLDDVIPQEEKEAQAELALQASKTKINYNLTGIPAVAGTGAVITEATIDVLSVKFTSDTLLNKDLIDDDVFDYVRSLIGFLLLAGSSSFNGRNVATY